MAGRTVGNCDFNENPVVRLDLDFDLGFVKSKKMQNIDETPPVISPTAILKRPPFLFFEVESWFLVWNPVLGSCLSVQKELGKNNKKCFFFLEIIGGIYAISVVVVYDLRAF